MNRKFVITGATVFVARSVGTVAEYDDRNEYWPAESLARREAQLAKVAVVKAGG